MIGTSEFRVLASQLDSDELMNREAPIKELNSTNNVQDILGFYARMPLFEAKGFNRYDLLSAALKRLSNFKLKLEETGFFQAVSLQIMQEISNLSKK